MLWVHTNTNNIKNNGVGDFGNYLIDCHLYVYIITNKQN